MNACMPHKPQGQPWLDHCCIAWRSCCPMYIADQSYLLSQQPDIEPRSASHRTGPAKLRGYQAHVAFAPNNTAATAFMHRVAASLACPSDPGFKAEGSTFFPALFRAPNPRVPPRPYCTCVVFVITPCEANCLHRAKDRAWPGLGGVRGVRAFRVALQLGAEQDCPRSRIGCAPTQYLRTLQIMNNMSKAADEHPMHACGCRSTKMGCRQGLHP